MYKLYNIIDNVLLENLNNDIIFNENIKDYKLKLNENTNTLKLIIEFKNLNNKHYDYNKINDLLNNYVNENFYNISIYENDLNLKIIFSYDIYIKNYIENNNLNYETYINYLDI